jgi:dTDP-glucose 4,6-dehydratase
MDDREPTFVDPGEDHEEPDRRIPDVSRARDHLNWEATTPLRDGLEMTFEQAE